MKTRIGLALSLALGASLLLQAGEARADERWQPITTGHRVWLETDIWPTDSFAIVTMDLAAQIAVHRSVAIDIDIPWTFGSVDAGAFGNRSEAAFGNPTVGAHFGRKLTTGFALHVGGTLSIPTRLSVPLASAETVAFANLATVSRAYDDIYRLTSEIFWTRILFGVEAHFANYLYYRGDFNQIIGIPVGRDNKNDPATVLLEQGNEFEARANNGLGGGMRLQFVFGLTDNGAVLANDRAQVALEPYFCYEPHAPNLFARVGTLVALDKPLGFGLDQGQLAVIRATIGGKF